MRRFIRALGRVLRRANRYHLVSRWRVPGSVEQVYNVLIDAANYPRWWKGVFLEVAEADGPSPSRSPVAAVRSKGFLPYRIRFTVRQRGDRFPYGFTAQTRGDFVGHGRWTFEQQGEHVSITFDWKIRVNKPLIRRLSFPLKPLFITNHRWAMARGQHTLRQELARRPHPQVAPATA